MLDKIFRYLFDKDKQLDNKTIIRNRQISTSRSYNLLKKEDKQENTCLSKYFYNRRGLNFVERNKVV